MKRRWGKGIMAVFLVMLLSCGLAFAIEDLHKDVLYTTVRVRTGDAVGSGLIFSSLKNEKGTFDTYVLTNHHVVDSAISITEEWDPLAKAMKKKETRATVEVEQFVYQDLSCATGTLLIQADILEWNKRHDLALLKLRADNETKPVKRYPVGKEKDLRIFNPVIVCGAGLGHAPFPTSGMISSLVDEIENLPYWMVSAPAIYGNSGGACFLRESREFIGIPSRIAVSFTGWSQSPITHMAYIIPISRIYSWLKETGWESLYDPSALSHDKWLEQKKKEAKDARE